MGSNPTGVAKINVYLSESKMLTNRQKLIIYERFLNKLATSKDKTDLLKKLDDWYQITNPNGLRKEVSKDEIQSVILRLNL